MLAEMDAEFAAMKRDVEATKKNDTMAAARRDDDEAPIKRGMTLWRRQGVMRGDPRRKQEAE